MFFDDKKHKNINLGDKKIESKDNFLKKLKDDKEKDIKKHKLQDNNKKISKFLSLLKKNFCPVEIIQKVLKNLKTTKTILNLKKDLDYNSVEKIIENTFEKLKPEILKIYKSNNKLLEEVTLLILFLLKKLSQEKILFFLFSYKNIFLKMYTSSVIHLYNVVKKDYLIDEKLSFFIFSQILENVKKFEIYRFFYLFLSQKNSIFFFFNTILKSSKKLIDIPTKKILLQNILQLNKFLSWENTQIFQNFYENSISYILSLKDLYNPEEKIILRILSKTSSEALKYYTELDFIFLLNGISEELSDLQVKDFFYTNDHKYILLSFFKNFFYYFRKIEIKITKDKTTILKNIYNILEFIFEYFKIQTSEEKFSHNLHKIKSDKTLDNTSLICINPIPYDFTDKNNNQKNLTEKLIFIIYFSSKLIKKLYESSYDTSNLISLLDLILNKLTQKSNSNNYILDKILLFSVKFLDYKNDKNLNFHNFNMKEFNKILQIISFCIYSKIEYRENYFFLEFKNNTDIYHNIPFNFIYLNNITKLLIFSFSYLINKKDLEYIEKLSDSPIIHCLKSLYNLDSEIQFSYSKDNFWSNMELISKIQKFSQKKLVESMKIMPFIFPFVYRLTFLNNHLKAMKRSQQVNNQMQNQYDSDEDNYGISSGSISFTVHRKNIFEETLGLYVNNKLKPYVKWAITFVNEFGIREEGGIFFYL